MTAIVFAPLCQAAEPYRVEVSYTTDVLTATDETEQRRRLRTIPTRRETYTVGALDSRAAGQLEHALITGPDQQWAVPYWPHVTALTAAATVGSGVLLNCDTSDRDFVAGGQAILWRAGGATTELVTISGVVLGGLTVATLASDWPVGSSVLPARTGRLAPSLALRRWTTRGTETEVTFDLDAVTDPAVAAAAVDALANAQDVVVWRADFDQYADTAALLAAWSVDDTEALGTWTLSGAHPLISTRCPLLTVDGTTSASGPNVPIHLTIPVTGLTPGASYTQHYSDELVSGTLAGHSVGAWVDGTVALTADGSGAVTVVLGVHTSAGGLVPACVTSWDQVYLTRGAPLRFTRDGDPEHQLARTVHRLAPPTGNLADYPVTADSRYRVTLAFGLASRQDVNALLAWWDSVRGRLLAQWVPLFWQPFEVASAASGATALTIQACGYTAYAFPREARRHVALVQPDGTVTRRRVTASVDNGDGTETLTLSSAFGVAIDATLSMLCPLVYARADSDTLVIEWDGPDAARASLPFLEVPAETPATD